jgi:dihydrofolate reductase
MAVISVFNFISVDGYYKDLSNGISWHKHGGEEGEFSAEGLGAGNILLFGRVTYDMMYGFWPTQNAIQNMPVVAEGMNNAEKIVFSKTMQKAEWNNTRVIKNNIVEEIKKMKQLPGKDMTILGSGSILTLFAENSLIDEYQIMIDPVAIGKGESIFKNMNRQLDLKLTSTRIFKSGTVLLCYKPE